MKKAGILILIITILLGVFLPASLAWFVDHSRAVVGMNSYVHKSYFESGDGTARYQYNVSYSIVDGVEVAERGKDGGGQDLTSDEGCAFEIKYPVQLYYFAWLQYLGYFNQPETVEGVETGAVKQTYIYLSEDLDMTGWTLPPIGTSTYPFVGNFDGNGHTISNLTIQNVDTSTTLTPAKTLTDLPVDSISGAEIIGFFGVIGSMNNTGTVNGAVENAGAFDATPGYSYTVLLNEVKNFTLDGVTVNTETSNALIGAIAGYVNGTVSNAAVSDTDVVVDAGTGVLTYTANLSDYALVGYCTDACKFTLNVSRVTLHTPGETQNIIYKSTQGEGAGFGGSIQMKTIHERISSAATATPSGAGTYVTAQRVVRDADGRILSTTPTATANVSGLNNYRYYGTAEAGYYYRFRSSNTYDQYLYITQESMTVTNIRYTGETESGYTISNGTYYLNLNAADGLTTEGDDPTGWIYANNHIYTYSEVDGAAHYLNGTTSLSADTTATTSWSWDGSRFSYTYNGMTYYLQYSGGWTVVPAYYYLISDGQGNYLRYNNGLVNTTNSAEASSHWTFSTLGANPGGYISTTVGNTTYYLRYDNGLTTYAGNTPAGNATSWSNNGTSLYSGSVYIRFNGSSWIAGTLGTFYAIHSGANYLNITATNGNTATLGTGTSVADLSLNGHTLWSFSSTAGNPSGTISATVNGTTYYLNDNAGTLTATTANSTSWSNNGTSISNGTDYLVYDGGWTIETVNQMAIKSGSSYLNITGTNGNNATLGTGNSVATGSVSGHTVWTVSNSGQIYAVANGNTYYLRNNSGTLSATTTNYTGWTVDATHIYSGNYYLYYDATNWKLVNTTSDLLGYTIYYNDRNTARYLNLTSTNTRTNNPIGTGTNVADLSYDGHTVWTFETTGTYPSGRMSVTVNGATRYLYGYSNSAVRISANPSNYDSWTNTNGRLQVRSRNLRYNNGWSFSTTNSNNTLVFTPIYATVTLEAGSVPSVTVTSETEPAPSVQAGRVDSSISALTRSATNVSVLTRDPDTKEASSYYAAMPINASASSPYTTSDTNTGYIVSGNYSADSGNADIRISYYPASSISTATNGSYNTFTAEADARMEVITALSNDSYSGWYRVIDDVNQNNSSFATNITNAVSSDRRKWYTELGLKRYEDARDSMTTTLVGNNNVYGLHFMDASIDVNHLITLPEAHIEGETYYNYQVPNDCIDFNVKRRGYITVFAGTYFTNNGNNNTFFSLHEIKRYEATDPEVVAGIKAVHDIKSIKEISKIYRAAEGSDFIYQYTDLTYSSNGARGTLAFDMEWMTNPDASKFVMNAVYYFEIPVNGGEFALGSVPGKRGAYLFYLDIAANAGTAEDKDRVTVTEKIKDESYSVELPRGVQLVESGYAYDAAKPYELATFALKGGFNGTYPLKRTGSDVLYTENTYAELTYIGATLSVGTDDGEGGMETYAYYPNGYVIRYLEHVTDKGRDTDNYDHFLIETIDTYDSSGTRTGRTVKVYADVENLEVNAAVNEADLDLIVTFTYDPAGHSGMKTRVVRAVSEGGFNISFDQNVTIISASVTSESVHVNFGDNTASTLITASAATPLAANTVIPALDMSGETQSTVENKYFASVYGPNAADQPAEIATYFNYYEGDGVTVTPTTAITMPELDTGNAAQARTLTYAITLTPGVGVSSVKVYGKRLLDSYTYSTKVLNEAAGNSIIDSGTVTVTVSGVTVNGISLGTTNTEITINGS